MVVVSLFVNPAQFNEHADLDRYPRDEAPRRARWPRDAGADVLFAPSRRGGLPRRLRDHRRGARRDRARSRAQARGAAHFRGVTTVVTKLLCMALPDVAYFGQKDAQQLLVIRRLVADLEPARCGSRPLPTVREPDGLALSSRNAPAHAPRSASGRSALPAALARGRSGSPRRASARAAALLRRARRGARRRRRSSRSTSRSSTPTRSSRCERARRRGAAADRRARRRRAPDRQRDSSPPAGRRAPPTDPRKGDRRRAARDAQVEDPPRDGDRQRPALRRARSRSTPTCSRPPTSSSTSRCTWSTSTTAPASRPTRSPARRGSGDDARQRRRRPARAPAATRSSSSPTATYDEADLERYEPRVVHVEARTNRIITIDDEVATAAHLSRRRQPASERNHPCQAIPTIQTSPSRPRAAADDAAAAGREEAARRPDRDGHRLRLPERPRRRGGRRRSRAGRRLGRHHRARLQRHDPGRADRHAGARRAPSAAACARRC